MVTAFQCTWHTILLAFSKVAAGSGRFHFSAPNWDVQGFILRSAKIQCKRVWLNCLKSCLSFLGTCTFNKFCSESLSVPFKRTLRLTLRFQNKNVSVNRDKAARVFPDVWVSTLSVCPFLFHNNHFQLSLSGLHLWMCQRRNTASLTCFL